MEQKEIKIVAPKGYEIDRENSTLECIKFKKKTIRWRDNEDAIIRGYFITGLSEITELDGRELKDTAGKNVFGNWNVFATKKQAKSALAMARISQIMANDPRFGGVVTDEEWENGKDKFVITKISSKICYDSFRKTYHFLAFRTKDQLDLFFEENEDLVRDYLMID